MQGLVFAEKKISFRKNLPVPERPAGWSRIRVTLAGICNTDLEIVRGYMGFSGIPGHEFVGVVEESDDPAWTGRRVVGEINAACGVCDTCRAGDPHHCPNRTVLGIQGLAGAFADYLVLPDVNLHAVPGALTDAEAVFTEPVAAACRILDQVPVRPTDRVLVVGAGKLGLLVGQVLATRGCELAILVRSAWRERMARDLGLAPVTDKDLAGRRFDIAVEASGHPDGFAVALRYLRPRGTLVLKSTYEGTMPLNAAPLVIDEITVVGSRCGPFPPALAMLASGAVRTAPLIDAEYPLAKGPAAFRRAGGRDVLKVLLRA